MGRVDCEYQHMLMGEVLANVSQFKKWHKKSFLVLSYFIFLKVFTVWNFEVNILERPRWVGQTNLREIKKWEFYSISFKEMITYVDNKENQNF